MEGRSRIRLEAVLTGDDRSLAMIVYPHTICDALEQLAAWVPDAEWSCVPIPDDVRAHDAIRYEPRPRQEEKLF